MGGWLGAILRNVCLTRLRNGRGEIPFDDLAASFDEGSSEPSAEEAIDRLALREWVWTALGELPETLRVTAMLRYFGSYSSYEEISAILGVPIGTVCSRLSQAKVKLAEALLKTAGRAHDEARRLAEARTRYFAAAFDEYNRKQDYEAFVDAFSDDLAWAYSDGTVRRGRASLVYVVESDLEAGMRMRPANVLASKGVTVIEVDFENPSDDPSHCPPASSMVCFYCDARIRQVRQYFAPRPDKGRHDPEEVLRRT